MLLRMSNRDSVPLIQLVNYVGKLSIPIISINIFFLIESPQLARDKMLF